jgi:hypothetical protein
MGTKRRKFKLANAYFRSTNLKNYEQIIIDTINQTIPGKDPKVFEDYFSTNILTQSEAVSIGRALSKIEELSALGQEKTIFRLFDGKTYDSEEATSPSIPKALPKGGRRR